VKKARRGRYWSYGAPLRENRRMRRTGSSQHFFTVRGRGFTTKQWRAILELSEGIVRRAKNAGIGAVYEGDARRVIVRPDKGPHSEHLVIWRKGEPDIPKSVTASGEFDAVVQSVLVATKKVAPDIFVMTTPDGRDYRRLLAKQNDKVTQEAQEVTQRTRQQKDQAFMQAVKRQRFRHPETKNNVEFVSLPKAEQTKIRHQWDAEYGRRWDLMADRAIKKLREAEKAKTEARRDKEQAEEAAKDFSKQKQQAQEGEGIQPRKAADEMNDEMIRKAAIRVAHSTDDKNLKLAILEVLRDTVDVEAACKTESDEKEGRHEEGKSIDVGDYLKSKGHKDDAERWEKHEGEIGKKSSAAVVFPDVHDLAWRHVLAYAKAHPESKTASGSTASRVAASDRLAKKWISDAIERPGRVHEYLGVPEDQNIPMGKLDAAIEKVKGTGNKSLLSALLLAKRLKGGIGKKKAEKLVTPQNLPEIYRLAADHVIGFLEKDGKKASTSRQARVAMTHKLAKKWISDAIKRPRRVHEYLGVPEDQDIPMGKLDAAIEKVKGTGNKSLLSALLLAKRLKGGIGKKKADEARAA